MRLFLALRLSSEMEEALLETQAALKRQGLRGRYTRRENLHLTLAFIGQYPDPEAVLSALKRVPEPDFSITLGPLGRFGDLYWAGLRETGPVTAWAEELRRALREGEIPFDAKKFTPHITLVRRGYPEGILETGDLQVPSAGMRVRRATLMRSDLGAAGSRYMALGTVPQRDRR